MVVILVLVGRILETRKNEGQHQDGHHIKIALNEIFKRLVAIRTGFLRKKDEYINCFATEQYKIQKTVSASRLTLALQSEALFLT